MSLFRQAEAKQKQQVTTRMENNIVGHRATVTARNSRLLGSNPVTDDDDDENEKTKMHRKEQEQDEEEA